MKVSDLKVGQGKVDIELTVKSKGEVRTFNKFGKDLQVSNAVVGDDSGDIKLSLWNQDCDKVNDGDKIKITNGYVSEFNGEKQLTSGKFGKLEVLGKDDKPATSQKPKEEKTKTQKKQKNEEKDSSEDVSEEEDFDEDAF